jgi:predicted nucleotidyltransferase
VVTVTPQQIPGTPQHQAFLRSVLSHYAADSRVLAVNVYGSLGRGNWDSYSDVDLDIVVADDVQLSNEWVAQEVQRLLSASGSQPVVVFSGHDEADFILPSLLHGSICFHPLNITRANIVESVQVLGGKLDRAAIIAAGQANQPTRTRPLATTFGMCLEYLVVLDGRLHRQQFWLAYQSLYLARVSLIELFTASRLRWTRPYHVFEAEATDELKRHFGQTLPQHDLASL